MAKILMLAKRTDASLDRAGALRTSVLDLIDGDGLASHAHPRAWGARMIVGLGP